MAKAIPLAELPVIDKTHSNISPDIFQNGAVILMDKPLEWTSFDVVSYVRNRIPPKKVGHAGTLDPLATGLLVLCSGKATKSISQIQELSKTYEAEVKFGESTPSYDGATEPDEISEWKHITEKELQEKIVEEFSGEIYQVPPMYSAIKVKGERLYKLARRGETIKRVPRPVTIYETEIKEINFPFVKMSITCSKGTYIRSVAHDLGIALQSRAHLTELRRTHIGHFNVDNAFSVEQFNELHLNTG